MDVKTRATIEELYKEEGNAELVHGEVVKMPPAGDEPIVWLSNPWLPRSLKCST